MKVHEAVTAVMRDVSHVEKGDRIQGGQGQPSFNFRGVDRTVSALSASIRRHGLVILPTAAGVPEFITVDSANNRKKIVVRVLVQYTITGPEGDTMSGSALGEAMDNGDKAVSKAMSVAWRTFLLQTFFLPTDEPDPDTEQHEIGPGTHQSIRQNALDGVMKHWSDRARQCTTKAEAYNLYQEALSGKASPQVLGMIEARGGELR